MIFLCELHPSLTLLLNSALNFSDLSLELSLQLLILFRNHLIQVGILLHYSLILRINLIKQNLNRIFLLLQFRIFRLKGLILLNLIRNQTQILETSFVLLLKVLNQLQNLILEPLFVIVLIQDLFQIILNLLIFLLGLLLKFLNLHRIVIDI